jgi:hypothetical protein
MTEKIETTEELLENPFAPEIFASGASSFSILSAGSAVSITLASARWNGTENRFQHVVIGRLVMPLPGAQGLVAGLNDFLVKQGYDPSAAIAGGETAQ